MYECGLGDKTSWNEHQLLITECKLKPGLTSDQKIAVYSSEVTTRSSTGGVCTLQRGRGERAGLDGRAPLPHPHFPNLDDSARYALPGLRFPDIVSSRVTHSS